MKKNDQETIPVINDQRPEKPCCVGADEAGKGYAQCPINPAGQRTASYFDQALKQWIPVVVHNVFTPGGMFPFVILNRTSAYEARPYADIVLPDGSRIHAAVTLMSFIRQSIM